MSDKPRVFWIMHRKDGYDLSFKGAKSEEDLKFICAHEQTKVIEYSAYESLLAQAKAMAEQLKMTCYCDAGWYRSTSPCDNCETLTSCFSGKRLGLV